MTDNQFRAVKWITWLLAVLFTLGVIAPPGLFGDDRAPWYVETRVAVKSPLGHWMPGKTPFRISTSSYFNCRLVASDLAKDSGVPFDPVCHRLEPDGKDGSRLAPDE